MSEMVEIQIEIDSELKEEVEKILNELGLDIEAAIVMFLEEVARTGKIPFEIDT